MVAEHGYPWECGVWPPQEQIPEKICEQIVDVHVSQDVGQVFEAPKISSQDRNLQYTVGQILDVLLLEKAERLVEVPETVSQDRLQQRTVEEIVDAPVPQAEEELAEVFKVFSQDRIQQRTVEQIIPVIPLAEKIVELPVVQTEERTQRGVNACVQHVVNTVEVEKYKIIEETMQRMEPIIKEKINQATKHIKIQQAQCLDKAGNMPVVVQRQIPVAQTVQETMEVSPLQFTDKVVDTPVVAQRQIPIVVQTVQTNMEIPQLHYCDEVIDVPVVLVVQAPLVQVMMKRVQISQLPFIEKISVIPEIRTVPGPQTSESLSVDSRGLNHQDCEALFHVNKQSPDIARGVHVDRDVLHAGNGARTAAAAQHRSTQQRKQWQQPRKKEEEEKGREEREKGRKGQRGSGQEGRKEEEKEAEDGGEQVENDVTGWTEVTRKKRRKTVQIFVKVDEAKVTPMDVSLTDGKVEDVMRQVQKDEDVYVTMHGRALKRNENLKSCGVTDGCTIQVTSRMRGGGRHKDKKSKVEKKQVMKQEPLKNEGPAILESEKEAVIRMLEETEEYRKIVDDVSGGSDVDMEWKMRYWASKLRERPGADILECGLRWAVEARRKGRDKQEEQRRQAKQGEKTEQEQSKQGSKCVSAKNNSWGRRERKTQANQRCWMKRQRYGQAEEAQASSEGEMRDAGRTRPAKGKEKGMEERVSTKAKEEVLGTAGNSKG